MNSGLRKRVYDKYGGRCAYCGHEIDYRDMQVDHIHPQWNGGTDDIENLNPSCRLCNHYKRGESLEELRSWKLRGLADRLRKIYIVRVAEMYGIISFHEWDGKFYFEKHNK